MNFPILLYDIASNSVTNYFLNAKIGVFFENQNYLTGLLVIN